MRSLGNIVKKRQVLVGQRLAFCRKKAGLSKSALARLCLADVLGVRVRDLMSSIDDSRSRVE